ncbi:HilA/EilA family virulence transcriptional regulator [Obesumbacterium proteus]|uniref:HilA/EilA family virulence transcriptional regulator n=1 Tax=Obesumbacterium proteus TaxID=82983 RepID=UPI0024328FA0|nr:HilA/EilA family virulence transcriptional regulator [Obesumbacterium proteus]
MEIIADNKIMKTQQYAFGDFILNADGILAHNEQQIRLPPKELAVLSMLLVSAGTVVSKNSLLDNVWPDNDVSEESLTRCIYSLRRILLENKYCRYIETIYGKGYRFTQPVAIVAQQSAETPQCSIAILPFQAHQLSNADGLHDSLINSLLEYSPLGLFVLPAVLTQHCHNFTDIVALIDNLNPDYYLAGQTIPYGDSWKFRVELVRANGHHLVHHESIELCPEQPILKLMGQLANMLLHYISELRWKPKQANEFRSLMPAIVYLNARYELQRFTPSSLQRALTLLLKCVATSSGHTQPYCSLAECYLTMSQLGLFDQQQALILARQAVNNALALDPSHPQALGLLALLSTLHAEHVVAKALFKQAKLSAPDSVELYYYHAWSQLLSGDRVQAQQSLKECLKRDPTHIAASTLNIWLTYCDLRLDEAISLAKYQLCQYAQDNPVMQSIQALLLALKGEYFQAEQLIQAVRASGEESGLIAVNLCYVGYCQNGSSDLPRLQAFLSNIDSRGVRASLLPLILAAYGKQAALQILQQLLNKDHHWNNLWLYDPRLSDLMKEVNHISQDEQHETHLYGLPPAIFLEPCSS